MLRRVFRDLDRTQESAQPGLGGLVRLQVLRLLAGLAGNEEGLGPTVQADLRLDLL